MPYASIAARIAKKYFNEGEASYEELVNDIATAIRQEVRRNWGCPHCDCKCESCIKGYSKCGSNLQGRKSKA